MSELALSYQAIDRSQKPTLTEALDTQFKLPAQLSRTHRDKIQFTWLLKFTNPATKGVPAALGCYEILIQDREFFSVPVTIPAFETPSTVEPISSKSKILESLFMECFKG
jgi:hypothetical protein